MTDETTTGSESPDLSRLRRELARGTAEMAVLSVLVSDRRYGYELLKVLRGSGLELLKIKEGTLYPLLHRLEAAGMVIPTWETEGRTRPRKYYEITDQGRCHLQLLRSEWNGLVEAMKGLLAMLDEVQK